MTNRRMDTGHGHRHHTRYIRKQLPKLKAEGHDTAPLQELLDKEPVVEPAPDKILLDLKSLMIFFYEEPDRYADMVDRIRKAEVPIEAMREELVSEGCWATEDNMAGVTAELLTRPPFTT